MRKYLDRIEIWQYGATADGYGGNLVSDAQLGSSWAKVKTIPANKLTDLGLDLTQTTIKVNLRYRADIDFGLSNLFIKYKSREFTVQSVTEVDLNGREFEIIAAA